MPFVSQAQRAYMHIHHPKIANDWEKVTPHGAKLPYHVAKKRKKAPKRKVTGKKPTGSLKGSGRNFMAQFFLQ